MTTMASSAVHVTNAMNAQVGAHYNSMGMDETDPSVPQDLPPPPPTPDPTPPRPISPACVPPPPPPPPPPPVVLANGPQPATVAPPLTNGDIAKMIVNNPPKLKSVKNLVDGQLRKPVNPNIPLVDPRNDLLKAIRDGGCFRKRN